MENLTIPMGHTTAHGHSGTLGWGPAARPKSVALGQPMSVGRVQRTRFGELTGASPKT
jgi:hypothetical protein